MTSGNAFHNEVYCAVKSTSKYAAGCCSIHHDPAVWLWEEAAVCETVSVGLWRCLAVAYRKSSFSSLVAVAPSNELFSLHCGLKLG